MDNFFSRKNNTSITIALAVSLVIAIGVIIYMYMSQPKSSQISKSIPNNSSEIIRSSINASKVQQPQPQLIPQHNIQQVKQEIPMETRIHSDKPTLVLFWGEWCGYSKMIMNDWNKAAEALNQEGVVEALDFEHKRDATEIIEAQKKLPNFKGFPDIRFFPEGYDLNKPSVQFTGMQRTEENFIKFAYSQFSKIPSK